MCYGCIKRADFYMPDLALHGRVERTELIMQDSLHWGCSSSVFQAGSPLQPQISCEFILKMFTLHYLQQAFLNLIEEFTFSNRAFFHLPLCTFFWVLSHYIGQSLSLSTTGNSQWAPIPGSSAPHSVSHYVHEKYSFEGWNITYILYSIFKGIHEICHMTSPTKPSPSSSIQIPIRVLQAKLK